MISLTFAIILLLLFILAKTSFTCGLDSEGSSFALSALPTISTKFCTCKPSRARLVGAQNLQTYKHTPLPHQGGSKRADASSPGQDACLFWDCLFCFEVDLWRGGTIAVQSRYLALRKQFKTIFVSGGSGVCERTARAPRLPHHSARRCPRRTASPWSCSANELPRQKLYPSHTESDSLDSRRSSSRLRGRLPSSVFFSSSFCFNLFCRSDISGSFLMVPISFSSSEHSLMVPVSFSSSEHSFSPSAVAFSLMYHRMRRRSFVKRPT